MPFASVMFDCVCPGTRLQKWNKTNGGKLSKKVPPPPPPPEGGGECYYKTVWFVSVSSSTSTSSTLLFSYASPLFSFLTVFHHYPTTDKTSRDHFMAAERPGNRRTFPEDPPDDPEVVYLQATQVARKPRRCRQTDYAKQQIVVTICVIFYFFKHLKFQLFTFLVKIQVPEGFKKVREVVPLHFLQ